MRFLVMAIFCQLGSWFTYTYVPAYSHFVAGAVVGVIAIAIMWVK